MSSNRNVNIIKGISAVLILLAGVGFFLAFNNGLFDGSFPWIIVAIAGGVIVLILSGIMILPRARVQRPSGNYPMRIEENYKDFEKIDQRKQSKDFVPSEKFKQKENIFCNYCGVKLDKSNRFCTNCGQKIE
ncbi:MAG: zinc ribbon domain-containing protein [Candidatus Thorarchaeota archaeon]